MTTDHFQDREFRCGDGCGILPRLGLLQIRLEDLREIKGGRPVVIVSGYRCPVHNQAVGGADRSRHTTGEAADLRADLRVTVDDAKRAGFRGIGLRGDAVVHVDVRNAALTVWRY